MYKDEIISNFSHHFGSDLAIELVEDYEKIKEAIIQNKPDYVGQLAGKFFETTVKVLLYVKKGIAPSPKGINFEKSYNLLINESKSTIEDEILTLLIPQILKGGYSLRNKKRISHSRGIKPNKIDAEYLYCLSNWVMSEILRIYSNADIKKIEEIINHISTRKIPLIQEISNEKIILDENISATSAILLILHSYDGNASKKQIISDLNKYYKETNLKVSLTNLIKSRQLHEDAMQIIYLTERGYLRLEDFFSNRTF